MLPTLTHPSIVVQGVFKSFIRDVRNVYINIEVQPTKYHKLKGEFEVL